MTNPETIKQNAQYFKDDFCWQVHCVQMEKRIRWDSRVDTHPDYLAPEGK